VRKGQKKKIWREKKKGPSWGYSRWVEKKPKNAKVLGDGRGTHRRRRRSWKKKKHKQYSDAKNDPKSETRSETKAMGKKTKAEKKGELPRTGFEKGGGTEL